MNAVSCCGLQLYNFGETVSIPYWTDTWKPDSFFEKIIGNFSRNLHTLCLLGMYIKLIKNKIAIHSIYFKMNVHCVLSCSENNNEFNSSFILLTVIFLYKS